MTTQAEAYKRAAYPPPMRREHEPPRPFTLRWNSRKEPRSTNRYEWRECQGILWTAHDAQVAVSLSNGLVFETLDEMKRLLSQGGDYTIEWPES